MEIDNFVEELLAQPPALVTVKDLKKYKAQAKQLISDRIVGELEDIYEKAPNRPSHRDDQFYFDIGYEVVERINAYKAKKEEQR